MLVYINHTTVALTCLDETTVLTWQPGAITTYALPVVEIEIIISKLTAVVQYATPSDANKVNRLINNWNTVLNNYRAQNDNLTSMFSAEVGQFVAAVSQFKAYQAGQTDAQDFASAVANTLDGLIDFPVINSIAYALNGAFFQIKETCDQVLPYSVGITIVGASEDFGGAGSYLQGVCDDFDPDLWRSFAAMINGACAGISADGSPNNPLSSTPLFQRLCASETLNDDSIPGGSQSSSGPESLLGFLSDSKKLVTFGANSPMDLSWTSRVTESKAFSVEFESSRTLTADLLFDLGFEVFGVGLETKNDIGLTNVFTVHLGKSSEEDHDTERSVTVSLGDNDIGDFFAVRITEDPVYGTPVFTTMGGASKCPGETGTSRRESNVRILEIRERCGEDNASPCNEFTLAPGENANFGVVIENLSPTQDAVSYTLGLANSYDDYLKSGGDGNYTCGVPGQSSGVVVIFFSTDLRKIPYNHLVEVPFTVTRVYNGPVSLCNEFNQLEVKLVATCEISTPNSYVYQYGVEYDESTRQSAVMYDAGHTIYASSSNATFSVKWPAARRRLSDGSSQGLSQADGGDAADAIAEVLLREFRESKNSFELKLLAMANETRTTICVAVLISMMLTVITAWMAMRRVK